MFLAFVIGAAAGTFVGIGLTCLIFLSALRQVSRAVAMGF
jgi:hypothetical protein